MNAALSRAIACAIFFCEAACAHGEIKVLPDEGNYILKEIVGSWEVDAELSARVGGKAIGPLEFRADPMALEKIPTGYHADLADYKTYQLGYLKRDGREFPYMLVEVGGVPGIVYFLGKGTGLLGDFETLSIAVVPGKDDDADLLFVSDREGRPSAAYRRAGTNSDRVSRGLQKKISLQFDRNDLHKVLDLISDEIGVPISMESTDFQLSGITKNQSMGMFEPERTAEEMLRIVLTKADKDGQLVFVVRPGMDGRGEIVVCTRDGAKKRKEQVPAVFDQQPPKAAERRVIPPRPKPGEVNPFGS